MEADSFVAIDFETATADRMACQLGVVSVTDGEVTERKSILIQPPGNKYDVGNINTHHITPDRTAGLPTFDQVWPEVEHYFRCSLLVAHKAAFDQDVLYRNLEYYGIMAMGIAPFRCTCELFGGRGLHDLCLAFGMDTQGHHDALFDAECCAHFYLNHLNGVIPDYSLIPPKKSSGKRKDLWEEHQLKGDILKKDLFGANPDNPFYDRRVVITGEFSIERKMLAQKLKSMGADINTTISKRTHYVLMGEAPGPAKKEKVDKLIHDGYNITVLHETDLMKILDGEWHGYAVEQEIKKDLDFTYEHYEKHHQPFDGKTNHVASRNLYIGKGLTGNFFYFAQLLGNLGAATDKEIYDDTQICVLSDATLAKLKQGEKDETILYIQNKYNTDKSILFDWSFISESDVLEYSHSRSQAIGDMVTMELWEKYKGNK